MAQGMLNRAFLSDLWGDSLDNIDDTYDARRDVFAQELLGRPAKSEADLAQGIADGFANTATEIGARIARGTVVGVQQTRAGFYSVLEGLLRGQRNPYIDKTTAEAQADVATLQARVAELEAEQDERRRGEFNTFSGIPSPELAQLRRQLEMAQLAAKGQVSENFLGSLSRASDDLADDRREDQARAGTLFSDVIVPAHDDWWMMRVADSLGQSAAGTATIMLNPVLGLSLIYAQTYEGSLAEYQSVAQERGLDTSIEAAEHYAHGQALIQTPFELVGDVKIGKAIKGAFGSIPRKVLTSGPEPYGHWIAERTKEITKSLAGEVLITTPAQTIGESLLAENAGVRDETSWQDKGWATLDAMSIAIGQAGAMTGGALAISKGIKMAKGDFAQANTADKQKSFQPEETQNGFIDPDARLARASATEDSGQNLLGNDLNAVNLFDYSELELDPATADRLRAIEEGLRKDARATGAPAGSEKVVRRGASARDNETAQLGRSALEFIAGFEHLTGKKVEFVDTPRNPDVPFAALVNKAKPNTIYLHTRGDRNVIALIGHEWGHTLQQQDPKLYRELQIKLLPLVDSWRRRTKELATDYRRKVRSEELTNNIIGDAFAHPDFWQFLSEQNKPLFSKVRQSIKQWFEAMFFKARGSSWGTESFISDLEAVHNAVMQTLETAAKRGPYSELPAVDDTELSTQKPRKDGSPETSQVRFSKSTVTPSDIGAAFLSLSENPETARLGPTPSQKDLPSILRTLSPRNSAQISIQPNAGIFGEGFTFHSPGGSIYLVKDDNTTYHVNSAGAGKFGTDIYQAIYAWAHNNGKVVREDDVMLDDGIFRRTSQMLSSAIRFQTTRHMTVGGWSGIKGWRKGDSPEAITHNVGLLAMRERDIVRERLPILDEIRYDLETNAFYDEGHRIPDEEIETYLGERIDRVGSEVPDRVGPSTLRRALVVNELERSGTGSQRGMLGGLSRENKSLAEIRYAKDTGRGQELEENAFGKGARRETPEPKSLDASFTIQNRDSTGEPASVSGRVGPERSRQTLVSNHPTVSRVEQILDGIQSRWGSRLKTKVHESVDTISDQRLREGAQREGNVEAFFDPSDGTIHIIADRVNGEADVERLLRHEGIHWAFNGPLRREYLGLLDEIRELIPAERWQELSHRYKGHSDAAIVEEYLAYEGQNNPRSSAWQSFAYEVKRLLRQIFGDKIRFTDSNVLALLSKANRKLERNSSPGVTQTSSDQGVSYSKKGQGRENWDDVQSGDDFNAVKKLLPRSADAPLILDTRKEPEEIFQAIADELTLRPTTSDPDGLSVLIDNPEKDTKSDPLSRARHLAASKEDLYKRGERVFNAEKAKWTLNIWKTIEDYGVKIKHYNDIAYARKYRDGTIHIVFVENGKVTNQVHYDVAVVSQRSLDSTHGIKGATVYKKREAN